MNNDTQQNYDVPKDMSPADYRDFDLKELQKVADYITRDSIPVGMNISQSQGIVQAYMDFLNISLYNLNLLRSLAGDDEFPIPMEESTDDNA